MHKFTLPPLLSVLVILCFSSSLLAQVWNTQVADSTGITKGSFISIVLDNNDQSHILYQDLDQADLRYTTNKSGAWKITEIDTFGYTGNFSSMAIDGEFNLHISYFKNPGLLNVNEIKYGYLNNGTWDISRIDTLRGINVQTNIAINPNGNPCVTYIIEDNQQLIFSKKSNDGWEKTIVSENFNGWFPKILFKTDGTPIVCAYQSDSIHIYQFLGDVWEKSSIPIQIMALDMNTKTFDVDIDSEDKLHFAFNSSDALSITFFSTTYLLYDWDTVNKKHLGPTTPVSTVSIKVSDTHIPYVFTATGQTLIYKKDNQVWHTDVISEVHTITGSSSLYFDKLNNPCIALFGLPEDISDEKVSCVMSYRYFEESPLISLSQDELNFGTVWSQSHSDKTFWIKNSSDIPLTIQNINSESTTAFYNINTSFPQSINAHDSLLITLRFKPDATGSFEDNILISSDDVYNPIDTLKVFGSGVENADKATLQLKLNDLYLSEEYLALMNDKSAEGVSVTLHKNNSIVSGPAVSNAFGMLTFEDLDQGLYAIEIYKDILKPNGKTQRITLRKSLDLGPAVNSMTYDYPDSLFRYKFQLMHNMRNIDADGVFSLSYDLPPYTYQESLNKVDHLVEEWSTNLSSTEIESLARLLLTESFIYELFGDGSNVAGDMMSCFGDLIAYIYYSDEWGAELLKWLKAIATIPSGGAQEVLNLLMQVLIRELIKIAVIENIDMLIKTIVAEIDNYGAETLITAWKIVKNNYCGFSLEGFSSVKWDKIGGLVIKALHRPFIQEVYIDLQTGKMIENACSKSRKKDHTGSISDAITEKMDFISEERSFIETMHSHSSRLRTSADLMMQTSIIINWVASLVPGVIGSYLDQAQFYMKAGAYVQVGTALTVSTAAFFLIPEQMEDAVPNIYYPVKKKSIDLSYNSRYALNNNINRVSTSHTLSSELNKETENFSDELQSIKNLINDNHEWDAVKSLFKLREKELIYEQELKNTLVPIFSGAYDAHQIISGFEAEYDTLVTNLMNSKMNRLNTYLTVVTLAGDSSAIIKEKVLGYIDTCLVGIEKVNTQTAHVLDLISKNIQLGPSIAASDLTQTNRTISKDEENDISFKVKNYGGISSSNISAKINLGPGLSVVGMDSIFIGELNPGQESEEISFRIAFITDTLERSVWDIEFTTSSGKTFPSSGVILKDENDLTGLRKHNKPVTKCFPNPANGQVYVKVQAFQNVSVSVYNQLGQLISVHKCDKENKEIQNFMINTENLENGTYYLKISSGDHVQTEKVIVMN